MRSVTRRHLAGRGAAIAALLVLAAPARAGARADPPGWARLASSRWAGLSVGYPPSVLRVVRPPAALAAADLADVDRLVDGGGEFEATLGADDTAVGSAGEYVRLRLGSDPEAEPSARVTYRAGGPGRSPPG